MYKDSLNLSSKLMSALIWLVLGIIITYHIGYLYTGPFPGFKYDPNDGDVTEIYVEDEATDLQIGDIIIAIGPITLVDYKANPDLQFWSGLRPGDPAPMLVDRAGEPIEITYSYPGRTQAEIYSRLYSQWWLAYIFWIAGLAAYFLIRPRDILWRLLVAFNLLTALWFTTGSGPSRLHILGSVMVTRAGIWATVPILIHLHLIFPKPFPRISKKASNTFIVGVYIIAFGFIIASLIQPQISASYILGFFLGLLVSVALLISHYLTQKETRDQIKIILRVTSLAFAPILITLAVSAFIHVPGVVYGASVAGLPLISISYFYAISRGRLGRWELQANRAISSYLFAILLFPILVIVYNVFHIQTGGTDSSSILILTLVFIAAMIAVFIYPVFQRFIERRILGIPLPHRELLQSFSSQITTSRDTANLSSLFADLILPSLSVRQSVLLGIENRTNLKIISLNGLTEEELPSPEDIHELINLRDKFILPQEIEQFSPHLNWIKVVLPLTFNKEIIGVWLLGRRDPNDLYDVALIQMLKSLAHQTSLALVNHTQTQRLRALYQANIDRHENERAGLARDLHDDALNNLALLQHETNDPDASRDIEELITNLRKTIHGLRPEMLSYGLLTALQDLGDTLNERQGETKVHVTLQGTLAPIDSNTELHLFRIVQQACENSLRHAKAHNIYINGQIEENEVHISIQDDGIGFEAGENIHLSDLLAAQHYGLAGMHERADLIHAKMRVISSPGKGTTVTIEWKKSLY